MSLTPDALKILSKITTATITTVLLKKGLRNVWMRGARPLKPGLPRLVGPAFTLRFVPAREDLATPESWSSPISTRTAIEAMPAGCITVVDAMGITDAGIFGDILCARMVKRGVTALNSTTQQNLFALRHARPPVRYKYLYGATQKIAGEGGEVMNPE